jgi:hypothetical protein
MSNVLRHYLTRLNANHKRTTAFHPRTNGKCERLNGILKQMLRKYCSGNIHRWDDFVDTALFATRIRTHRSHGHSPFFLTYGVEPRLPGDGAPPILLDPSGSDPRIQAEFRSKRLDELGRFREAATKRAEMVSSADKERWDSKIVPQIFDVGDQVLIRLEAKYGLDLNWFGPFKVLQRNLASGIYKLSYPNGAPYQSWVHTDRLIQFTSDDVNAPFFSTRACTYTFTQRTTRTDRIVRSVLGCSWTYNILGRGRWRHQKLYERSSTDAASM